MATTARQSDYISTAREHARKLWQAYHELRAMQDEWNANDFSNTLTEFVGENVELDAGDIGAVVFDTANEIKLRIFDTGHATNLARLL